MWELTRLESDLALVCLGFVVGVCWVHEESVFGYDLPASPVSTYMEGHEWKIVPLAWRGGAGVFVARCPVRVSTSSPAESNQSSTSS